MGLDPPLGHLQCRLPTGMGCKEYGRSYKNRSPVELTPYIMYIYRRVAMEGKFLNRRREFNKSRIGLGLTTFKTKVTKVTFSGILHGGHVRVVNNPKFGFGLPKKIIFSVL